MVSVNTSYQWHTAASGGGMGNLPLGTSALAGGASDLMMPGNLTAMSPVLVRGLMEEFRRSMYGYQRPGSIALLAVYVPAFVVALLGNVFVLVIVLSNKHMRNVTNYFIVNLAVADLLVAVICMPTAVAHIIYRLWIFGEFMCKTTYYLQGVAVASSVYTLTVVSLDRYLAIRHPIAFRKLSTARHAWQVIVVIWFISVSIMIPLMLTRTHSDVQILPGSHGSLFLCMETWNSPAERKSYGVGMLICIFIVPGLIIALSYIRIGCNLVTDDLHLHRRDSEICRTQMIRILVCRKRVARMLLALIFVFGICWLPYNVTSVYLDLEPESKPGLAVLPFMLCIGHCNSAINPVLYCLINKYARKAAKRFLVCREKRKSRLHSRGNRGKGVCGDVKANVSPFTTHPRESRRTLTRQWSRSSHTTSGSVRFSRASNRSFRSSTPNTTISSVNYNDSIKTTNNAKEDDCSKEYSPIPTVMVHSDETRFNEFSEDLNKRKRENMRFALDIPSTINEESSRTPTPSQSKVLRRDRIDYESSESSRNDNYIINRQK